MREEIMDEKERQFNFWLWIAAILIAGFCIYTVIDTIYFEYAEKPNLVTTTGRLSSSSVFHRGSEGKHSYTEILYSYTYSVGGILYSSNRLNHYKSLSSSEFAAYQKYSDQVTVYYDPANPGVAVLDPEKGNFWPSDIPLQLGGAFLAIIVFIYMTRKGIIFLKARIQRSQKWKS